MSIPIDVKIKDTSPMTVAFLSAKGHFNQIPEAFGRLYGWITDKGYKARGPAIAVYYDVPGQVPDDELRWELRSQIAEDADAIGPDERGLGVKQAGAIQAATTMYNGPYEEVEHTYQALIVWIAENGYEINGPSEELYFNDTSQTPSEEPLVEIRIPIRKK